MELGDAQYLDVPAVTEQFSDWAGKITVLNGVLRIEFGVVRFGEPKERRPPARKRIPVARLVMPITAAIDLHRNLGQVLAALETEQNLQGKGS